MIVDGESIGLFIAFSLAQSFFNASAKARIIVIDIFDKPFAAASSHCTGCFHYGFSEKESEPLLPPGKYPPICGQLKLKARILRKERDFELTRFLGVKTGIGKGIEALPDWIQPKSTWDIDRDFLGHCNATVYFLLGSRLISRSHFDNFAAIQQVLANGSQLSASSWE